MRPTARVDADDVAASCEAAILRVNTWLAVCDRSRPENGKSREAEKRPAHGFCPGFSSGQLPLPPAVIVAPLILPPAATLPQLAWAVEPLAEGLFGGTK